MIALDQQLADTRQELERLRATNRHTALRHRLDMATMKRRKAALERQYKQASETELGTNSNSLVYAQAMSKSRIVSISVLYVEAKLCRTEHQLGALEHQAHIQKKMCSDVCDQMDTLMEQMKDEKKLCQNYFDLLHAKVGKNRSKLKEKYISTIAEQQQQLAQLRGLKKPVIQPSLDKEITDPAASGVRRTSFVRAGSITNCTSWTRSLSPKRASPQGGLKMPLLVRAATSTSSIKLLISNPDETIVVPQGGHRSSAACVRAADAIASTTISKSTSPKRNQPTKLEMNKTLSGLFRKPAVLSWTSPTIISSLNQCNSGAA